MMAVRLLELRRLLKPTGSIYLHCDPTASHYLKLVMDCVFGHQNFRNEIAWKRTYAHGGADGWGSVHDVLLFYTQSQKCCWTDLVQPHDPKYLDDKYSNRDKRGCYQVIVLTGSGTSSGASGEIWKGYDPSAAGRHWAVPRAALSALKAEGVKIPDELHARLDLLFAHGYIYLPKKLGGVPRFKRYLSKDDGLPVQDIIADIPPINSQAKERLGYPTQKPLALLDRIIEASSNEGDVVLDPFCGCATTCVSAHALGRLWTGIDISPKAAELIVQRLQQDRKGQQVSWMTQAAKVIHRTDIPKRTDVGKLPPYKTHRHTLYGQQEGRCRGCRHHFPFQNFTVDHIVPRAKGGTDHLDNLQLLCNHCNSVKGTMDQAAFAAVLKARGIGAV